MNVITEQQMSHSLTIIKNPSITIDYLPITTLVANIRNPRIHTPKQIKQIAASIREFGFNVPILIDHHSRLIAGHGRLLACAQLGIKDVPVIKLEHLSEAQAKAYMIADNKLTENSSWDGALLAEQFRELSALDLDFSLDITGFEMGEIDFRIQGLEDLQKDDTADDLPESGNAPVITRLGDSWQLGNHRLLCADSTVKESYEALMGSARASMIFTDPPYNVRVDGHVSGLGAIKHREFAMASGEMGVDEFIRFLERVFQHMVAFSTDGSLHFICMDWRHISEIMHAGKIYDDFKNLCVWVKDNGGMGSLYRSRHELVFVFKNGKATHVNNVELGKHGRYRTNVWEYAGANSFSRHTEEGAVLKMHPTVKPVQMVADAILDASKRGDIILDSFLGSGTTLMAAERVGRYCYGMEIDPAYVDLVIRRWEKWTGEDAIHAQSGKSFSVLSHEVSHVE